MKNKRPINYWEEFLVYSVIASFLIPLSIIFLGMFLISKSFLLGGIVGMGILGIFFGGMAIFCFNKLKNNGDVKE